MDRRIYLAIGLFFLMLVAIIIVFIEDKVASSNYCREMKKFKAMELEVSVKNKFLDTENHNVPTVLFHNGKSLRLNRDTSRLFDYIEIGDTVLKLKESLEIKVVRSKTQQASFVIYFGC